MTAELQFVMCDRHGELVLRLDDATTLEPDDAQLRRLRQFLADEGAGHPHANNDDIDWFELRDRQNLLLCLLNLSTCR